MSKRMGDMEADCEHKMSKLKGVCKDWMDKVKDDMGKTEDVYKQRLTQMQMVAKEWEGTAQATNDELRAELAKVRAEKDELAHSLQLHTSDEAVVELEKQCKALDARMMQAAEESVGFEIKAEQMAAEAAQWKEQVTMLRPQIEERDLQVVEMELTIEAFRKLCAEYTLRSEEAEAKLAQAQAAIQAMDAKFTEQVTAAVEEHLANL
eukprot:TRINITY_DN6861_c0_g1_i3.p2 TRINITY_DN6861_c0_g1~~TRINITY_DN6861_c0_g1_i3.p2  ORF type:complete len:207 (+),score=86.03 TRINITY_DN6861_c0_g1_i3:244-864(+)